MFSVYKVCNYILNVQSINYFFQYQGFQDLTIVARLRIAKSSATRRIVELR